MGYNKNHKDGGQRYDRFLHAAQIHYYKHQNKKCNENEFIFLISYRQKAEYGIATGNNRNCNCQHIIDDQSAA